MLLLAAPAAASDPDPRLKAGLEAMEAAKAAKHTDERPAHLDRAIAVFRAALVNRPGNVRVRLELALAFYMKPTFHDRNQLIAIVREISPGPSWRIFERPAGKPAPTPV